MELFESMSSSIFGGTKSESVEPLKESSQLITQLQDNFKFLTNIAKDMTTISESVKSLVEMKGGMPATESNLDTTPEPEIEVEQDDKGFKMPKSSTIMKILGGILAVGALVAMFWEPIKNGFMKLVENIYDSIKEQFKKFVDTIGSWLGGIADTVMSKFNDLKTKLVDTVSRWFENISQWVGEKIETIVNFFKPVQEFISKVFNGFKAGLKMMVLKVINTEILGIEVGKKVRSVIPNELLEFLGIPLTVEEGFGTEDDVSDEREKRIQKITRELKNKKISDIMKERGLTGKQGQSEARRIVNEMDIDFRGEAETQFRKERKEKRSSTKPTVLGEKEQKILSKSPVSSADREIKAMIIAHEGVRYKPYKDSLGLWTVGVGHLIGDGKTLPEDMNRTFSADEIAAMFEEDYKHHKEIAEKTPGYEEANKSGKGAMIDLAFNMGKWWPKWPNTSKALREGDFEKAAEGLEDSKWYTQVGRRADTIVGLIANAGDKSAGADMAIASVTVSAGQRSQKKPKTPNVTNNENITVVNNNQNTTTVETVGQDDGATALQTVV